MARRDSAKAKRRDDYWSTRSLIQQHLGVFPGVPMSVCAGSIQWLMIRPGRRDAIRHHQIEASEIGEMQYALEQLKDRDRKSLRQWSPRPDDWLVRLDQLLCILGKLIRSQQMDAAHSAAMSGLSRRWRHLDQEVRSEFASLSRLLDAMAFLKLSSPQTVDWQALKWIQKHAVFFQCLPRNDSTLVNQLSLCLLRDDLAPGWMQFLVRAMESGQILSKNLAEVSEQSIKQANQLAEACGVPTQHIPDAGVDSDFYTVVTRHLGWLLAQKPKIRRRTSRVLGSLIDTRLISNVESAVCSADQTASRIRSESSKCHALGGDAYIQRVGFRQARDLVEAAGVKYELLVALSRADEIIARCQQFSGHPTWSRDVAYFFELLREHDWQLRVGLLFGWGQGRSNLPTSRGEGPTYQAVMRAITPLLKRRGVSSALARHWKQFADRRAAYREIVCVTRDEYLSEDQWRTVLAIIEALAYDSEGAPEPSLLANAYVFAKEVPDRTLAVLLAQSLHGDDAFADIRAADIEIALRLSHDPDLFSTLLKRMDDYEVTCDLNTIIRSKLDRELRELVCRLLLAGNRGGIDRLARHIASMRALWQPLPALNDCRADSSWIDFYPTELHTALARLNRCTPDAKQVAQELLADDCPDPQRITRELRALRDKVRSISTFAGKQQRNMQQRIASLEKRLSRPNAFSKERLGNLETKILQRVDHELVTQFASLCQQKVREAVQSRYGESLSPRLQRAPYDLLLPAIMRLQGAQQRIGIRLLLKADCEHKNAEPLEPANRRFVESMTKRGFDMGPWLDACRPVSVQTAQGETVQLAFATDSLDVLMMGLHFDTCLSPTSFNFFSSVANAIDINKQVLYCRDQSGKVLGRCLFAINSRGQIQTFQRYCHDEKIGFDEVVDRFAIRLAAQMKTVLTCRGVVARLVSKDWYDDGPLRGGLSMLESSEDDAVLPAVMKKTSKATIVSDLIRLFGSRGSVQTNLSWILALREFCRRPNLIEPVAIEFARDPKTSFEDRMRMALLTGNASNHRIAHSILETTEKPLAKRLKSPAWGQFAYLREVGSEKDLIELLIAYKPKLARRYIKSTRPLKDNQESREYRRKAIARIDRGL